ncbi:iron ABC transporter permease [Clostridium perfringens]|uniref:Iron ABC transporter permease n=3 Tax=Clostridium perfringens TaxID=1502 RepID=A0AAD2UP10_CLOPF|nr:MULTISPECIES: iron ABC transporter permease [Clostridium]AMN32768.1 ABC transporter [Clostridium perfringens]AOY53976.1 Vitamin B12 ABC transporter, permease component BtuC [Clostridium perfringens]ATD48647.1 iron ABC transporter permease [Clostridium perfringens]EDT24399.1 ABC transporter, iron chelate uptake transporter (FeCT) family, permease protein [Clostridium perfringens B str. ATCC 3626]EGT0684788.1 iron ABC transporter permease [Clostridium perfringens]
MFNLSWRKDKKVFIAVLLILLFISSIILGISFGAVDIPPYDVYRVFLYKVFGIKIGNLDEILNSTLFDIIWGVRMPRVLLGAFAGMALAMVGVIMQATIQNPLGDPYILGLSSGASLGATFSILIGFSGVLSSFGAPLGAFLGALIASIFVYFLAKIGGRITPFKMILAGMVISSICSSLTSLIIFLSKDNEGIRTVNFWMMGSLAGAEWSNIVLPIAISVIPLIYFFTQYRNLNLMVLGDETSITLGLNIEKHRKIYMILSSLITGVIVSVCGTIGFVGIMIPHIVRLIFGTDHKTLLPFSALVGAIFLIWADVIARCAITNMELPIGIITSVIGAPFLLWLMVKGTREKE